MSRNYSSTSDTSTNSWSPQQRKEILKNVLARTQCLQENINKKTLQVLSKAIEEADNVALETSLTEKINNQEEVLLDSEMMNVSSIVLKRCTKTLTKTISSYNYVEFAENIVRYMQKLPNAELRGIDWSLLENEVLMGFKRIPVYSTLLGTLTPLEKKEIAKRKAVVKDAQAPIKRPENVVTTNTEEKSVEETIEKVNKFIRRYYKTQKQPLNFFKLILHPTDFGKTIENVLHVSFLIRDGIIKLLKDSDGTLIIQPCSKEMSRALQSEQNKNVQNVMSLNIEQWKILKHAYRLQRPMMDFDKET